MTVEQLVPYMPHFQAILNTLCAVLLGFGYYFIRQHNTTAHRLCMIAALSTSVIFMVSYLTYHAHVGYLPFTGQGMIRPFYFTLLTSHVILAALIVPLVLMTVFYAAKENFNMHPKIARWTLPLWFYVSVSGVLVYGLAFHAYAPDTV